MKNSLYRNSEGYFDPTAGKVLARIDREEKREANRNSNYRPIVYICSKYAGDIETNVANAKRYCRFAADTGYIPFCAHLLYPQFLNDADPAERKLGLFFGNIFMDKCHEIWIFGDEYSSGMRAEYERAQKKHYKIRYFTEDLKEVTP